MKASGWLFLAGLAGALFSKNKTVKFISVTTAVAAGGYSLFTKPSSSINGIEQNKDFCPICGEKFYIQCKCAGFIHTLDDIKRGHGKSCKNGHTWYYNKNCNIPIVWPDNLSLQGIENYNFKKVMSGPEFVKTLEKNGWIFKNHDGSHRIYEKNNLHISVPMHKEIKKGTLHDLKKRVIFVETFNK